MNSPHYRAESGDIEMLAEATLDMNSSNYRNNKFGANTDDL